MQRYLGHNIKIKCGNAKDVFALFAALNAVGYNDENNDKGMSSIRTRVRRVLAETDWVKAHPKCKQLLNYHPGQLLLGVFQPDKQRKQPNIQAIVADCIGDDTIKTLWRTYKTSQIKECEVALNILNDETSSLLRFVGKPPQGIHTLTVIANELDAYWRGYGLVADGVGYIIVGPGNMRQKRNVIRHELLHILAPDIQLPKALLDHPDNKALEEVGYSTKRILNREYVVRAVQIVYETAVMKKDMHQALQEETDFPKIAEVVAYVQQWIQKRPR